MTLKAKIKLIVISVVITILTILGIVIAIQSDKIANLTQDLSYVSANEKALLMQNDSNKNQIRSLLLTVDGLNYYNDSIITVLNDTRNKLKIKDLDLKKLQYLKTVATKTDTLIVKDTIFVENLSMDTTIQDQWHKTKLELTYPNKVIVTPEFTSEKVIITHLKKETIKPPKKCKFLRAFLKKHKVLVVTVEENNPYITTKEHLHIEIIK